ncbi:hypothetical protein EV715DRAFT_211877 [Schizophyllum commune]
MHSNNVSHLQEPDDREDADRTLAVSGQNIVVRQKDTDCFVVFATIATAGASEDCVTEAMLDIETRDALFSRPGFPEPLIRQRAPAYHIGPADDKGLGMFATRRLRMGTLIVNERPLTFQPSRRAVRDTCDQPSCYNAPAKFVKYTRAEQEGHLEIMLSRMTQKRRETFLSLKDSRSANRADCGPLLGRSSTNAWAVYQHQLAGPSGEDGYYSATFDALSRMNNRCRPNALFSWDTRTFSGSLRAVRDIAPDEEITVAYCGDIEIPLSERKAFLASYGFECTCPACSAGDIADERCAQILSAYEDLPDPLAACSLVEFEHRYVIQRMEEEGLENLTAYYRAHFRLTAHYRFVRNVEKAMDYQEKLNALSWAHDGKPFVASECGVPWPRL